MNEWMKGEYKAVIFEIGQDAVAYALYRERVEEIYLRHLFVKQGYRRQGIGRMAVDILRTQLWPTDKRLTVEVLTSNKPAINFWRSVGYTDYCLTLEIMPKDIGEQGAAVDPDKPRHRA
jgi:predicted acetyltransferase